MLTLSCPGCGGEVPFKSKASVFAICSYCKSTLVRHDMDLEAVGEMADLQDDLTPFQIGTHGRYDGKHFEILGRLRMAWEDGFWTEWYALFGDGREAWLAEAQGFYAMNFPLDIPHEVPPPDSLSPGRLVVLGKAGQAFHIDDLKEATCLGSEGELPFRAPRGRTVLSVDLSAPSNRFACLEYSEEEVRAYEGRYLYFNDFQFKHLRELDGW